jgi:hypothetical protein
MEKPPFGIAVSDCKTSQWFQIYPGTNTCLPNRMCDVLPYARKMEAFVEDPKDKKTWSAAVTFYEGFQKELGTKQYEEACPAGGRRRRTRRRGARSSRRRPTR